MGFGICATGNVFLSSGTPSQSRICTAARDVVVNVHSGLILFSQLSWCGSEESAML